MKQIKLHTIAALLGLVLAGTVGCGGPAKSEGEIKDEGRIRDLDIPNRTLVIRHRMPTENSNEDLRLYRTYKVAYDCRISTADKPEAKIDDLRDDDKVDVRYVKDGQEFILYRIKPD